MPTKRKEIKTNFNRLYIFNPCRTSNQLERHLEWLREAKLYVKESLIKI